MTAEEAFQLALARGEVKELDHKNYLRGWNYTGKVIKQNKEAWKAVRGEKEKP